MSKKSKKEKGQAFVADPATYHINIKNLKIQEFYVMPQEDDVEDVIDDPGVNPYKVTIKKVTIGDVPDPQGGSNGKQVEVTFEFETAPSPAISLTITAVALDTNDEQTEGKTIEVGSTAEQQVDLEFNNTSYEPTSGVVVQTSFSAADSSFEFLLKQGESEGDYWFDYAT